MTPERLEKLEKLAEAATSGPWVSDVRSIAGYRAIDMPDDETAWIDCDIADAAFIAASRTAIPELIAEVRRLRAALEASAEGTSDCTDACFQRDCPHCGSTYVDHSH